MDQLDPQVVNLAKAIRSTESGDNFNARSKDGSFGAYQFLKPTWDATARKFGVNADWEKATPEQQNEVAYKQIKEWKDQGHDVGQIASMWNAGAGKPDAYREGLSGTNKDGVNYDVGQYAKKVATKYQELKGSAQQPNQTGIPGYGAPSDPSNPAPSQPIKNAAGIPGYAAPGAPVQSNDQQPAAEQPKQDNLASDLSQRASDAGTAISSIVGGRKATGQSRLSGLLQTVGAAAGAVGDVTTRGLELVPGVKAIEGFIGKGAEKLASTPVGQKVASSIRSFSEAHPELSKDIGAGINIATAIPILDGIGAVKNVALDGASRALKSTAEKAVAESMTKAAGKGVTSDVIDTLVKERAIPEVVKGRYSTKSAFQKLDGLIQNEADASTKLKLVNAQDALQYVEGKPVELGTVGKAVRYGAAAAGELVGDHVGVPLVGGLLGSRLGGTAEDAIGNASKGILDRSGKNLAKSANAALRGTRKAAVSGLIQKAKGR